MPVVVEAVTVRFGERVVLDNLSAIFEVGLTAILGPSGSGKSTLLSVIAGHLQPEIGSVRLEGLSSRIDWIVQSAPVLTRRTAIENVMLGPLSTGADAQHAKARALEAMRLLNIDGLAQTQTFKLSGGERQRIAVARALGTGSDIIVADEPTASLDPVSRRAVCDALELASKSGRVVIVATHDPYVEQRCFQSVALDQGKFRFLR